MARLKPGTKKINNLDDANLTLKEIGMFERKLGQIDADVTRKIGELKEKAVKDGKDIRKRIAELSASLGAYAEYNKNELFQDRKTIELSFGKFGFRKTTKISVKKTTVALLKKLKLNKCIRIKVEPNKEAMAELADETLAQVDAVRKINDDFFCEADKEEVNKELLKKQIA